MSKCSVCRILKWKLSHWTLFCPKYWAWAVRDTRLQRKKTRTKRRTALGIDTPRCGFMAAAVPGGLPFSSAVLPRAVAASSFVTVDRKSLGCACAHDTADEDFC